jgi:hypothetical protein
MDTKRLEKHNQWLAENGYLIQRAVKAIWLELGRSGTISEETVIGLHRILSMMRTHLDTLQREVEATASYHSKHAILDLIAHFTFREKLDLLQALYEEWDELYQSVHENTSREASSMSSRRIF